MTVNLSSLAFVLPSLEALGLGSETIAEGIKTGGAATIAKLLQHFRDPSRLLPKALARAHDRSWSALELALDDKAGGLFSSREFKVVSEHLNILLTQASRFGYEHVDTATRKACAEEIRRSRKAGLLDPGHFLTGDEGAALQAMETLMHATDRVEQARRRLGGISAFFQEHGYANLSVLLQRETGAGSSLLLAAADAFFLAEVRESDALNTELTQTKLDALLREVREDQEANAQFRSETLELLRELRLSPQIRARDGFSVHNDRERQAVRQLLERLRALPQGAQDAALLNEAGILAHALGAPSEAEALFHRAATATTPLLQAGADEKEAGHLEKARAHYNALRASMDDPQCTDKNELLKHVTQAGALHPDYNILPDRFIPEAVLGGGGFGLAILCKNKYTPKAESVVLKILWPEEQERSTEEIFREAAVLLSVQHPNIINLRDCGYAHGQRWPYLLMDFFRGSMNLEEWVQTHGPLPVEDARTLAVQTARGLHAAHEAKLLHRDVKPANLLVRKEGDVWEVKVLDFAWPARRARVAIFPAATPGKVCAPRNWWAPSNTRPPSNWGKSRPLSPPRPMSMDWARPFATPFRVIRNSTWMTGTT